MTDVEEQMAKQPHPFVNGEKMSQMNDCHIAIVGKVDRLESGKFTLRTTDGKYKLTSSQPASQQAMLSGLYRSVLIQTESLCV